MTEEGNQILMQEKKVCPYMGDCVFFDELEARGFNDLKLFLYEENICKLNCEKCEGYYS